MRWHQNYAHRFPKFFRSLHTLLGLSFCVPRYQFTCCQCTNLIHFLTCTRIPCRGSQCESGRVRCYLYKMPMHHFMSSSVVQSQQAHNTDHCNTCNIADGRSTEFVCSILVESCVPEDMMSVLAMGDGGPTRTFFDQCRICGSQDVNQSGSCDSAMTAPKIPRGVTVPQTVAPLDQRRHVVAGLRRRLSHQVNQHCRKGPQQQKKTLHRSSKKRRQKYHFVAVGFWTVAWGGFSVQGGPRVVSAICCCFHCCSQCFQFSLCSAAKSAKPARSVASTHIAREPWRAPPDLGLSYVPVCPIRPKRTQTETSKTKKN